MKKSLLFLAIGCVLAACHSDLDLGNVDTKAQVEGGVALPVGSFRVSLKDIVGDVQNLYIDTVKNQGVITWRDTFPDGRSYHKVDLAERISTASFPLEVYNQLATYVTEIPADGKPHKLHFNMPLNLEKINDALSNERLDSALIDSASFITILHTQNFDIKWEWIDSVIIDLGDQINRPAGNSMVVYEKGAKGGFDTEIPTAIDNFVLCMMEDPNRKPQDYKVLNKTSFPVDFIFTIPVGEEPLKISTDSKLQYDLKVKFVKYKAIWGFFKPSSQMFAEVLADVGKSWSSLSFLKTGNYPFSDPHIKVDINTKLAGRLRVDSCYVFALDAEGHRTPALFDNKEITHNIVLRGDFVDPHKDSIGTEAHLWTDFDKTEQKGQIDRLFGKIPEKIGYKFKVFFDTDLSPQVRLTPDDSIKINAICTLPFMFKKGLYVHYPDTFHGINLDEISLDSLQAKSDIVDTIYSTNLKLVLTAKNTIPLRVKGAMRCFDEKGEMIMDPKDSIQPLYLFDTDTIMFEAPTYTKNGGNWIQTKEGETTIIASLDKEDVNILPKIKAIAIDLVIDDQSLQEAYSNGMTNISLREEQNITLNIGVAANVDAVLNFNKKDKETK